METKKTRRFSRVCLVCIDSEFLFTDYNFLNGGCWYPLSCDQWQEQENGVKPYEGKFRLNIRKTFFTENFVIGHWSRHPPHPRKWSLHQACQSSRSIWIKSYDLISGFTVRSTQWLLRNNIFFFLWFYGSMKIHKKIGDNQNSLPRWHIIFCTLISLVLFLCTTNSKNF